MTSASARLRVSDVSQPADLSADFPAVQAQPAYTVDGQSCDAQAFYALACDPTQSVAVEACAGAGKTWMLVSRMVLALLHGARPDEILAITFTRKAAAEMRQRLYRQLQDFAAMPQEKLEQELRLRAYTQHAGALPLAEAAQKLRGLYAQVLEQPRTVQARTFHGWFASLLRSAPRQLLLDMGLPLEYTLLEDIEQAAEATWQPFYEAVAADAQLRTDLQQLVLQHQPSGVQELLRNALEKRVDIELADQAGVAEHGVAAVGAMPGDAYATLRGVAAPDDLLKEGSLHQANLLALAQGLGKHGTENQQLNTAQPLMDAVLAGDAEQVLAVGLTKTNRTPLAAFTVKRMQPVMEQMEQGVASLHLLHTAVQQQHAWLYHQRVLRLVRVLFQTFRSVKQQHGWVDMSDMEYAACRLLSDSEMSAWVQQRLDAQLRYLLIDEFQDTSPLQWHAVRPWLEGYTGAGGDVAVFIVGDPKQSIYRFRRAEPGVFRQAKEFVQQGLGGRLLSCDHTRRCAQSVVAGINRVMPPVYAQAGAASASASTSALAENSGQMSVFRAHTSASDAVGSLEILPFVWTEYLSYSHDVEGSADGDAHGGAEGNVDGNAQPEEADWRDSFTVPREEEKTSALELEAQQVACRIQRQVTQTGCALRDIMVLSRRNSSLLPLHAALAAQGIPATVRESTALTDCLEVQDVLALLDVLCSPHHDLSLAQALRSPILGLTAEDISILGQRIHAPAHALAAAAQPAGWWQALEQLAQEQEECRASAEQKQGQQREQCETNAGIARLCAAWQQLQRWRGYIHRLPVHDVLQNIYAEAGAGRGVYAAFAASVPPAQQTAVQGNLHRLLTISLEFDAARFVTPYAFVRHLKSRAAATYSATAAAAGDAVQLLTVHGAKGLEAETVVLFDSDVGASRSRSHSQLLHWPAESPHPLTLAFLHSQKQPPPSLRAALEKEAREEEIEACNLLYVAATRARHTLLLSAHERVRDSKQPGSWYKQFVAHCVLKEDAPVPKLLTAVSSPVSTAADTADTADTADAVSTAATALSAGLLHTEAPTLWLTDDSAYRHTPIEQKAQELQKMEEEQPAPAEADGQTKSEQQQAEQQQAADIGSALHALLQWSPAGSSDDCSVSEQTRHWLQQRFRLDAESIQQAVRMAQTIRQGEAAWAWGSDLLWQANELPVLWQGKWLRLDRLVQTADGQWWVLDYKSSSQPEQQAALHQQMQLYRQAALKLVQQLNAATAPQSPVVRVAFITGEGRLAELPVPQV